MLQLAKTIGQPTGRRRATAIDYHVLSGVSPGSRWREDELPARPALAEESSPLLMPVAERYRLHSWFMPTPTLLQVLSVH